VIVPGRTTCIFKYFFREFPADSCGVLDAPVNQGSGAFTEPSPRALFISCLGVFGFVSGMRSDSVDRPEH